MLGWFKRKNKNELKDSGQGDEKTVSEEPAVASAAETESAAGNELAAEKNLAAKGAAESQDGADAEASTHLAESEPVDASATDSAAEPHNGSPIENDSVGVKEQAAEADPQLAKKGLAQRFRERLAKTRHSLLDRVDSLFLGKKNIDQDLLDELEEIFITADIGVKTTQDLLNKAAGMVARKELSDPASLRKVLQEQMCEYLLQAGKPSLMQAPESGPLVIMVLGVNGVGKTTTIGKMAYKFTKAGRKVMLVAADTFRAAASEQLMIWGERIGVEVVARGEGADPSSVIYDAFESAGGQNADVIIVDTAGRMHTKVNLVEELKKIKKVMAKKIPGAPHEIMLVLDATTGQNGISQARLFNEAVDVTGLTLTKLDGTAKGGIVINICREFNIPIRFIGIGEQMDDLRDFEPESFVEALFGAGE